MTPNARLALMAILAITYTSPALAHTGQHAGFSLIAGILHPLQGADHLAQMVLVGLIAARAGGRAVVLFPAAFVLALIAGACLGQTGLSPVTIQAGIATALLVAGGLAASHAVALPLAAAVIVASGLLHGIAHGTEAPASHFGLYVAGFSAASALLHAAGVTFALSMLRHQRPGYVRLTAAAAACAGFAGAIL